ncbi:hypothetical protein K474DRAFT_1711632 [Panus rudis PR-1116 ss-1]|nr:hypothetical protein K474DRAFT_1711632 [Panus rudis PR-1116 ss-1]
MTSPSDLLGAFVVTVCLSLILYGIVLAQSYYYMLYSGKSDRSWLRYMVLVVFLLEILHTGLVINLVYEYMLFVMVEMVIVALVQGFYLRRIFILSDHSIKLTAGTGFLLFLRISLGFATAALTYPLGEWSKFRQSIGPMITLSLGLGIAALVDALIAGILIYHIRRFQTDFKNTEDVIRALTIYIVNTGAITGVVSIAIILTYLLMADSLLFVGLSTVTAKLYSNSFLGTLNSRESLRSKANKDMELPTISNMSSSHPSGSPTTPLSPLQFARSTSEA